MKKLYENPASTVDLIVPYEDGIILIKRKYGPFLGRWALPGGYLECGKENLEQAGTRELFEETGLVASPKDLRLVGVYSEPRRDPRGHVISHVYEIRNFSGILRARDDAADIGVFRELPAKLAFDHRKILEDFFRGGKN